MKKGLYCYYNEIAKSAREPFVANTDDQAKLMFVNDMNQQKESFRKNKQIFPLDKVILLKLAEFDEEKPEVFNASTVSLMNASECPSYDDDQEDGE